MKQTEPVQKKGWERGTTTARTRLGSPLKIEEIGKKKQRLAQFTLHRTRRDTKPRQNSSRKSHRALGTVTDKKQLRVKEI